MWTGATRHFASSPMIKLWPAGSWRSAQSSLNFRRANSTSRRGKTRCLRRLPAYGVSHYQGLTSPLAEKEFCLSRQKTAIIIGAGPAGLTAAYELLTRTDIRPVVIEMSDHLGGISRTVNYKGNRIDIGGHRFFSKSDRVMNWWFQHLPVEQMQASAVRVSYQGKSHEVEGPQATNAFQEDQVMLIRERKSRIY